MPTTDSTDNDPEFCLFVNFSVCFENMPGRHPDADCLFPNTAGERTKNLIQTHRNRQTGEDCLAA